MSEATVVFLFVLPVRDPLSPSVVWLACSTVSFLTAREAYA